MTLSNTYNVTVRTENYIPPDVLIEHFAVALRAFNFAGKVDVKMASATTTRTHENRPHPFDGPEVFDDKPQLEPYSGPRGTVDEGSFHSGGYTGTGDGKYQPAGVVHKGDYIITPDTMEAIGIIDPYPRTTEVIAALQKRNRGR